MEDKEKKKTTTKKRKVEKTIETEKKEELKKKKRKPKTENSNEEITIEEKQVQEELTEPKEIVIEKQSGFNILEVIIIMFITLCFGGLLGSALTYAIGNNNKIITSIPEELKEFVETYEEITEEYYENINKDELLGAGIKGMINFLGDKYSVYMDKTQSDEFNEQVDGSYVGIGSEIQRLEDGTTIISNPFENGPAKKAGLETGDIILKVNGEDITDLNLTEISSKVKGKAGTIVNITIKRNEEEIEIPVTRGTVELTSVTSKIIEDNEKKIGYINIEIFAANSGKQFEKELLKLEAEGIDSLIIDVRNNSGGYLTTVTDIASLFLEKGKAIYQLDTKGKIEVIKDETKASRNYKVAVIINQYSASASEILAAAIKESYAGGEVLGISSYGKGTVQKAATLKNGATVKYTIQKWLTPNGNWINEKGVEPTKIIEQNPIYNEDPTEPNDTQLLETIGFLSGKEYIKKIEK